MRLYAFELPLHKVKFVDVILPLPLEGLFTYAVPHVLESKVTFGVRVVVPLGKTKSYTAMAVRVHSDKPEFEYKQIVQVLDDSPILLPEQYKLWSWIADYYMSPLGDIYKAAFPAGLKSEEGYKPKTELCITLAPEYRNEQALRIANDILSRARRQQEVLSAYLEMSNWKSIKGSVCPKEIREITREELMNEGSFALANIKALTDRKILTTYLREVGRLYNGEEYAPERIKKLNEAQTNAYNEVQFQFIKKDVILFHGVTSSGKTEVYIHLIEQALQEKKQVLYLLPEIALTFQIMERLRRVFGKRLGIYHSKYSDAERVEIWKKQLSDNPYEVILGARSAVFLPFRNLGLVIVDEEHETSFKQQDPAPRYHARSTAIILASMYKAKTLLGTATPSAESFHNAMTGKYGLVRLEKRYNDILLPKIQVVDIKDLQHRKMMNGAFSPQLLASMRNAIDNGEQVILFQNRRGFAPMIECNVCGWIPKCTNCDVSLTMHKNMHQLTCHYCGYTYRIPKECPNCESTDLRARGFGTEKIEDSVRALFPEARIARMDLDTTRTRSAYERIISDFSSGKTNILIGTQMISKGLDFDKVSVVGILNADSMMNFPDFRAYEHAFMMMAQVSGRAGRKGRRGLVILQTKSKDLPIIKQVVDNDYNSFYKELFDERRAFNYPPFTHLIYVYLKHGKEDIVESAGIELGSRLRELFGTRVFGPDKPAVARVKTLNIRKIMLKMENGIDRNRVRHCLRTIRQEMMKDKRYAALNIYYDIDPL